MLFNTLAYHNLLKSSQRSLMCRCTDSISFSQVRNLLCSMGCSYTNLSPILLIILFFFSTPSSISAKNGHSRTGHKSFVNHSVSTIFVFGDSTVDPGNNNYIGTMFKSDFPPYGQDFPNHVATGRFTNGKLVTDFIASYLGVKEFVPPYLDRTLSLQDLLTGVSFASAASGYDPLTPRISRVISLPKQLEYFKEYKTRLELLFGKERTQSHVEKAVYFVSAGTNDFVVNYFTFPFRRKDYNLTDYQEFLLQNTRSFIQDLLDLGARRIGISGLPPMGCLPVVITLHSDNANLLQRDCINYYSQVAEDYNRKLKEEIQTLQKYFANYGVRMVYVDIYKPISDMIRTSNKFGFVEHKKGCCGTGLLETTLMCNSRSYVCSEASKYIFWDSIHPTEKAYYNIFLAEQEMINFLVS